MGPEKHELSAVEFRKPAVAIDHGVGFEGYASHRRGSGNFGARFLVVVAAVLLDFWRPSTAAGICSDASLVDAEKVAEQKKTLFVGTDNDGPEPSKIVQVAD